MAVQYKIVILYFRKMSEEEYYVKAIVDGVAIDDEDLCNGRPTSSRCRYKVG